MHTKLWWRNLLESGHLEDWEGYENNIRMDLTQNYI
jgi:hypothetical protein